ncbi:hypothetical protein [Moorena bouillonii]|uniref:hypothetical protein n=1 Tax=Moorena bouillonii TaxID=207920 RepID=UPI00117FFC0B|nr:hypothetical protein [Moorena bouillonii]
MGRWGDGDPPHSPPRRGMGRWGDGDNFRQIVRIFAPIYRNIPSYPNHELLVIVLMQSASGGSPHERLHQERKFWFIPLSPYLPIPLSPHTPLSSHTSPSLES